MRQPGNSANKIFAYDPETGAITWRLQHGRKPAGAVAGCIRAGGYWRIKYRGSYRSAHRLAWLLHHGRWPKGVIDHINRDPADNRLSNLREATQAQNSRNQKLRVDNKLGHKGVHYNKASGTYGAKIRTDKITRYLGTYKTLEEAAQAYRDAAQEAHGEFCNL